MSNLIPIVTPANNTNGIALETIPTAIFEKSIEPGSISSSTCFIVEIPKHNQTGIDSYISSSSFGNIVQAKVLYEKLNLLDNDLFLGTDSGEDVDSGEKYRTKVSIIPNVPLKPNTNYAALLSKDISLLSVFDVVPDPGNTGDGVLSAQGPFTGLTPDLYTVTIATTGTKNFAKYMWTRDSDNYSSLMIEARGRLVQVDKGLKVEFKDGTFNIGDSFTVNVIPQDKQIEIFSWLFSTGSSDYQTPTDETSDDILNIPVSGSSVVNTGLEVVSITPGNGQSLVKIPRKASLTTGDLVFLTKEYTSAFNQYTIELIDGVTAGNEAVSLAGTEIIIEIEDGESTATQIADAFNSSVLVNDDFEASFTSSAGTKQSIQEAKKFSKGIDATVITVTFNKDLDALSIPDKIKIITSPIYPSGPTEELSFSYLVSGKQLIITLQEEE